MVTNKINGKQYIGYTTKTLEERKKAHLCKANSPSNKHYFYLFKQAIRKYGIDNFDWEVLETCNSIKECCDKEIYYINNHNTISPNGYNLTEGGNGGIPSEETKLKISKSLKTYWHNNKNLNNMVKATTENRSAWAKKSWQIKKQKGYVRPSYTHKEDSKNKMSLTKNELNKIKWFNVYTLETLELSLTDMSKKTGLSIGAFNHLKQGRQLQTKCGWKLIKN
jgi:group I intron endonuclease